MRMPAKLLREITPLTQGDCFTIFSRNKKEFDFPLHTHEEYELNYIQNAPAATQPQPQVSPQQLDDLVAPIAIYPDPLVGEVLAASTYPMEVAEAEQWVRDHTHWKPSKLMDEVKKQNWDPSIQGLVAFPDVLPHLTQDMNWTTQLGNAFLAQQADVMKAVQRM